MLRKLLLILALICIINGEYFSSHSTQNLYAILDRTTEYFKNLSNAYEILDINTSNNINDAITKYMENTTGILLQSKRRERSLQDDLETNKDVHVLEGFEEASSLDLPNFKDIAFFTIQDKHELLLFAAAVNATHINFHQFINDKTQLAATYQQLDGTRITINNYNAGTLAVVQKGTDGIVILRFGKGKHGNYEVQFKQEFEIVGVMHVDIWFGMNQLYLGIATETRVFIYAWLGEHFDKIDTLPYGARRLLSFQNKSSMYLVIVGSITKIFRFSVRSDKFLETQRLHRAEDVGSFHFKKGHFEEHFLVSANNDSTILYKEMYGRFVPFQRIAPTRGIRSLRMKNTVVLLLVEEDAAEIYQYNGWRFLQSRIKLSDARQIHQIRSYGEDVLIVQNRDGKRKFLIPTWTIKKTWKSSQDEINAWYSEIQQKISQRTLKKIPDSRNLVIANAYIDQLRVRNMNNHNAKELVDLTRQYNKTIGKLDLANNILAQITANGSKHTTLYGKKMRVKCRTNCYIHHIITDNDIKSAAIKPDSSPNNKTLEFANLKVQTINNWRCPIPDFRVTDIFVKGSINGMLMKDLQEKTLKISGDQEISGEHIFANLHATNASILLDIASNTRQIVHMRDVTVKDLRLTEDEFFLPLNSTLTVMNGSINAARVKLTGLIDMKGRITGKGRDKLAPLKEIYEPMTLHGDYFLENVTFRNLARAKDIIRPRGSSLKEILENSVPLNSDVPVHLILSSNKTMCETRYYREADNRDKSERCTERTILLKYLKLLPDTDLKQWSNVSLWDYTNWVTKNSAETVVISGAKFAKNVILSSAAHKDLPVPKLTIPLCGLEVITPEVKTSSITIDELIVNDLNVSQILGAYNLNTTIFDSVSALRNVNFSSKLFTGRVSVKNISANEIKGINLREIQMNPWTDINRIKGPVNAARLVVNNLEMPAHFNFPLPTRAKNVIAKANSDIEKINGMHIQPFMENVVKVNDIISLEHVTFAHGFTSNHVHASRSTLYLPHVGTHLDLRSKRISTTLEADVINVPQIFGYVASDTPTAFIVQGSVKFSTEPTVQNINDVNLKQLSEDLWMIDRDIVFNNNINFENITLATDLIINNTTNSLNIKMWLDLSNKLLSKTREQHITVVSSFKNIEVPAVIAANDSILRSSDFNLNDLLNNSLMKNTAQTINVAWGFEELNINHMNWNGKFNGIDLNTDIVRHDAKLNVITGKKTISNLATKNLWSSNINFSNFTSNALTEKCQKITTIKGRKTFNNITLNNLNVTGSIMGRNVEEALLKFGNQTLSGMKKIQGHLNAPSLIIDGTVNDVNLTDLMYNQMKKHKDVQTIESKFDFRNDLEILGNVTIDGLYERTNLTNITNKNEIGVALNRMKKVVTLAEDISTALENRAIYVNKLEEVDENALKIAPNISVTEDVIDLNGTEICLCEPTNNPSLCNDTKLLNIFAHTNSSALITKKLVLLDDAAFIVAVSSDYVSIYSYVAAEEQLYHVAGLYVPDIIHVHMEPIDNSLWIILRLSEQMLILRYQEWNEFEQYILPGSDSFVISKTPNNQRLLIRSDGIWNLRGVFHPEHIFKMSLDGQIKTFALRNDYYVKATTENSTAILKVRYAGN